MNETLTTALLSALNQAGIPAFPEYPQVLRPLPDTAFFVTAAVSDMQCGMPVYTGNGVTLPAELTLRVRYLFRADTDIPLHTDDADDCIMQTLHAQNCGIFAVRRGELCYQKTLDRMMLETRFSLHGEVHGNEVQSYEC